MATSSAPQAEQAKPQGAAALWAEGLGKVFRRVALFRIDGSSTRVLAVHGMGPPALNGSISLVAATPLRWAVEAASPIVGAGNAPGGALIAQSLGLSTPRAYAVIPLVTGGRLEALAYVDQGHEPLPLSAAAELFAFTSRVLKGDKHGRPSPLLRASCRSTTSRPRGRTFRKPGWCAPAAKQPPPSTDTPKSTPAPTQAPTLASPPVVVQGPPPAAPVIAKNNAQVPEVVVPPPLLAATAVPMDGVPQPAAGRRRGPAYAGRALVAATVLVVALGVAGALPLLPPFGAESGEQTVSIARNQTPAEIALHLAAVGIIRNPAAFLWLARLTQSDRHLKAGVYRLPKGAWATTVLEELRQGQVHTRTITIPEGLTLTDIANLIEAAGLGRATDILREANDPELLRELGVPAASLEGFLFPESYTLSLGLEAREVLTVMHQEFVDRLRQIPGAAGISKDELLDHVTLASIVEREVRDKSELSKVAGVFINRLERDMRLESCATVQYILGKPKKRLTLADVRIESPYNTYLNPGLPPGPIANPGMNALKAVFAPERHDYLFFFARPDGSHTHVFSKTFAEHQKQQKSPRAS
ncbi:MAG: endolytic transglycosylase MltG [Deltaproteobacteria bacterium]|nr:endolytic transglycosylase MltG [Deltaproteobacteria bacterium]